MLTFGKRRANLQTCGKSFKRPQDLRKHEKIHTEEHHIKHKQSKAITVPASSGGPAGSEQKQLSHPPQGDANAKNTSAGQRSEKSPSTDFNAAAASHLAGLTGQAGAGVANGFLPYMLPYPYGYGLPSAEQQAGLAEMLMQQQRLNAVAAQLMGLPAHVQQQQLAAAAAALAASSSPAAAAAVQQQTGNFAGAHGSLPFPQAAMFFPGIMPGYTPNLGNLAMNPATAAAIAAATAMSPPHNLQQQQYQQGPHNAPKSSGTGLYPSLESLFRNENNPVAATQSDKLSRASSTTAPSPGSSQGYPAYQSAARHSSHSGGHHSVSPHPVPPPAQQQQQQQAAHAQQYSQMPASANPLKPISVSAASAPRNNASSTSVLGKTKRSFTEEADALLNDMKKKRFDPNDAATCE